MDVADLKETLRDRVVIILVEPQTPGNVGAAARAMKNMGLARLTVVAPPSYDPEQARWMAPGAQDILASARIVATLDEALQGVHTAVASTARHRTFGHPVETPSTLAERFLDDADGTVIGVLFGREDHGLNREAVARCERIVRIPTPEHASLNLAQAVLLIAHCFYNTAIQRGLSAEGRTLGGRSSGQTTTGVQQLTPRDQLADMQTIEPAVEDMVSLLERVGYTRAVQPEKVRTTARQALYTSRLSIRRTEALRGMLRRIEWALDNPSIDWRQSKGSHARKS